MSQAGPIDFIGSHPQIPTEFITDSGVAIPIGNQLEILGTAVANHNVPLETTGSGNTVTVEVQYASANPTSDPTKAGVASFDSARFGVDANGFVTISGTGLGETITGNTGGPLSPTAGNWNIVTANATPIFSGAGSTETLDFGLSNLVLGSSLSSLTSGTSNTGVGLNSLVAVTSGTNNVAIGTAAMGGNTIAKQCVAVGANALSAAGVGDQNTAIGYECLQNFTGPTCTAVGYQALQGNLIGGGCTAVGASALNSNNAAFNDAFGDSSQHNQSSGTENCSFGNSSLQIGTSENYCCSFGYNSLNNCNGDDNSAFGRYSLWQITSGVDNTAMGMNSGFQLSGSSSRNTILGSGALGLCTGGNNNIALGYTSGDSYTGNESSNITIGNQGVLGESNVIRIGTQGAGAGQQNQAFMAGIYNTSVGGTNLPVVVDNTGKLGTSTDIPFQVVGTFTPTVGGTGSDPTVTYGAQRGNYSKTGRLVHIEILMTFASYIAGTGNIEIRGLPFAVNSSALTFPPGSCSLSNATFTGTWVVPNAISGSTVINLTQCGTAIGSTQLQSGAFNSSTEIGINITYEADS